MLDATSILGKALAGAVLFLTALGGVMLPWVLDRPSSHGSLSLANMFSAGVMLGAGLIHLLPDAAEGINTDYPVAYLLFAIGLIMPLAIEKVAIADLRTGYPLVRKGTEMFSHEGDSDGSASPQASSPAGCELSGLAD